MIRVIPDTNVLVQLLTGDNKQQHDEAIQLFRKAEKREIVAIITPVVMAESCFVLASYYKKGVEEITTAMEGLLSASWLEIEHQEAMRGMWGWYRKGMHFVDSYLLALQKYEGIEIVSFDKKLMKKSSI